LPAAFPPLRCALAALALAAALSARAAVFLSSTTFPAGAPPTLHADAAELTAAQAQAGPGGYYKLRAKFIVPYAPGYFQAIDIPNNNGLRLQGTPGAGQYTVECYWAAYDANGTFRATGTFYSHAVTVLPPSGGNIGLQADFFNGNNFQTLARSAASGEHPAHDWNLGGPAGTGVDNFSVRWTGQVEPLFTETYTFTTGSDDGMRVYVANLDTPLAGAYWDHGYLEASGSIQLTANTRYQIRVDFFENGGGATARLFWQSPSQPREIVPLTRLSPPDGGQPGTPPTIVTAPASQTVNVGGTAIFSVTVGGAPAPALQWRKNQTPVAGATGSSLTLPAVDLGDAGAYDVVATNIHGSVVSPAATLTVTPAAAEGTGNGLRGEYHSGTNFNTLVFTRIDPLIDFPWQNGAPGQGVGADDFSVRWTGTIEAPVSGLYTFTTRSDDGVRLKLEGATIIDDWNYHPPTERSSSPVYLAAGSRTPITLEYFEAGGGAEVALLWQPPAQARTRVPTSRLYAANGGLPNAWQTLVATSGVLYFTEDLDDEGNGNGNFTSSIDRHDVLVPGPGSLRVYTTGSAQTFGAIFHSSGSPLVTGLAGNGEGANFRVERSIAPGGYYIEVSGGYQWNDTSAYTLYVEFRPEASPPRITSTLQAVAPVGAAFSYQIAADSDLPVTFGATGLPPGLTVTGGGLIAGRPAQAGTFAIQVTAANAAGSDTETLSLTTFFDPPASSISASATAINVGGTVQLRAFASSATGTIQFLNVDQLAPFPGYYGAGDVDDETPPNLAHHPATNGYVHERTLALTLSTAGTYRFRATAGDGAAWHPGGNEVIVVVADTTLHALTVYGGTGGGTYAAGTVVPIVAHAAPAGQTFSHWSMESGPGTIANPTLASTTFTLGGGAAAVRAHYLALQPPVITASPAPQSVTAGQPVQFLVAATGAAPLAYQWRKDGLPLANGGNRSGTQTAQLSLSAVTAADNGLYDVVVTNPHGAATSAAAQLIVAPADEASGPQLRVHRLQ
ncbi:MAG TPA: hypothetical protein DIT64_06610, partial [Verrucomicrobiales bacterium]|nr:hypothetical protein [Verrucomicrobiales bacterium]